MPKPTNRAKAKGAQQKAVHERAVHDYRVRRTTSAAVARGHTISAADFKANCLALMDEVQRTGKELVITKHKRPVARLVPVVDESLVPFIGRGAGMIEILGDPVAPLAPDWEVGDDL